MRHIEKALKYIIVVCFCLMIDNHLCSQAPGWSPPNPSLYRYTANAIMSINLDSVRSNHGGDLIAVFSGNELRGLSTAVSVGIYGYVHFITMYSNQGAEPLTVKIYHYATNTVYDAKSTILFQVQGTTGSVDNPWPVVVYSDQDAPLNILSIPGQTTIEGIPFSEILLNDYLVQPDADAVVWSYLANANLSVSLTGDKLQVTGISGFVGTTDLIVRATEQTVNQKFAEQTITFDVDSAYSLPKWTTIPGQGIVKGSQFSTFELDSFENQYGGPCLQYDYYPLISPSDDPDNIPNWVMQGYFQNNMNIIAQIVYTPKYIFNHPDDKLVAYINNEIRGVAVPIYTQGRITYFMTVGGGAQTESITLKFYSGAMQKIIPYNHTIPYVPHRIEGSPDAPAVIDLSPLEPVINFNGQVNILIKDTTWTGEETYIFIAEDCTYPTNMQDVTKASFCIVAQESFLMRFYKDNDGDGYGNPAVFVMTCSDPGEGYVENNLDCDDNNAGNASLSVEITVIENSGLTPNDGNICSMGVTQLKASGGNLYLWNTGSTNAMIDVQPTSSTSYTVTVSNSAECIGTKTQHISVEGTVVVNSSDSGAGSLRSVLKCVNDGGTVTYDQPLTNSTVLTNPLIIDKNVHIIGLGVNFRPEIIIDFNQSDEGIQVMENKILTLSNVDLKLIQSQGKPFVSGLGTLLISQMTKVKEE